MGIRTYISFVLALLMLPVMSPAQSGTDPEGQDEVLGIVSRADSLRKEYRFQEALELYSSAAQAVFRRNGAGGTLPEADSAAVLSPGDSALYDSISARKVMAENGLAMSQYVSEPDVISRHAFSKEDFYLFYPMQDKSWRKVPNRLDSIPGHRFSNATYFPDGSREVYFSAVDQGGARNIYHTVLKDSTWSVPALIDESITSSGDEIFPVLSSDGNVLYFASSGLYGVGGYDLYRTVRDPASNTWGVPENLGFPYSSPYDDLLYFNTADGKYTLFASNRECSPDSVIVYVLSYDSMPVRRPVDSPSELKETASLRPSGDPSRMDTGSALQNGIQDNVDISRYMAKMDEVRALRDSVSMYGRALDEKRAELAQTSDPNEKLMLSSDIVRRESRIPGLQDSLARAMAGLQKIEMEFLFNGVVIDPDKVVAQADREVVGVSTNYAFTKLSYGAPPDITVEKPEVKFDYSFMILPEGRFAQDNTIPSGIVYQIQMFLLSRPATVPQLKGLSPVFSEKTPTGKYIYRVGVFRTYNDVLSNLNKVKKLGFKTAFIVAFRNGEPVSVQKARSLESKIRDTSKYQVRIASSEESLPELTLKAIRQVTDRDIAKVADEGGSYFVVGPLNSKEEADKLSAMVKITGIENVSVIKLAN